jgi:hypothetical protein
LFIFDRQITADDFFIVVDVNTPDPFHVRGAANSSMAIGDALRVDDIDYGSAPVGTSELRTVPANDSTAGRHLSSPQAVAFTLAELGLASNASTVVGIVILDAAGLDLTFVGLSTPHLGARLS